MDSDIERVTTEHQSRQGKPPRRKSRWAVAVILAVVVCLIGGAGLMSSKELGASEPQVPEKPVAVTRPPAISNVSLTFDSGTTAQMEDSRALSKYGLRGTFFINSGFIGAPGYMSRDNLQELANDGQEIGGHSFTFADLATMSPDEATRQVCNDRVLLSDWGFKVTSFSYPFGAITEDTQRIVSGCGYNSARTMGTLAGKFGCDGCAASETVIPANLYATTATANIDGRWTLADLQAAVTESETKGSWLQMVFGVTEESPEQLPLGADVFEAFCAWLSERSDEGTGVRTVHEMIGNSVAPVVAGPVRAAAPAGVNALENPGLEVPGAWNLPKCWQESSYGVNSPNFSKLSPGLTETTAANLTVAGYESGDSKVLPTLDLGECSPTVIPGHTYALGASVTSTERTQIEVYVRDATGHWSYWTASPYFPAASDPVRHEWTTPPVPETAVGLSFGFNLFSNGAIVTDDYTMFDSTGETSQ